MRTLRDDVMAQPADVRLEYALYLLAEVTGAPDLAMTWLAATYRLTEHEAKLFCALNAASPRILSRNAIFAALYGSRVDVDLKLVDIYVGKVRSKIGAGCIATHHGIGYSVPNAVVIPASDLNQATLHNVPWRREDDAELLRMISTGSDYEAIAEELDRSPGSIRTRLNLLQRLGKMAA